MVLGFGLLTAFAQGTTSGSSAQDVTVTVTDNNVTMSPTTLPVSVPVTFTFTNNGQNDHAFVIEKAGGNNAPLTNGGQTASFDAIKAGGNFSTTWTFNDAGDYQLAAYKNGTLEQGLVVTFTVGSAQAGATASPTTASGGAAQTGATASPTTEATASPTTQATATTEATSTAAATSAMTSTNTVTATSATANTTGQSPSALPRTGGDTTNWAAMLLAFGVAALVLGGALTFARRSR
jgi:LPXTG-motif cell wall-anchored protein